MAGVNAADSGGGSASTPPSAPVAAPAPPPAEGGGEGEVKLVEGGAKPAEGDSTRTDPTTLTSISAPSDPAMPEPVDKLEEDKPTPADAIEGNGLVQLAQDDRSGPRTAHVQGTDGADTFDIDQGPRGSWWLPRLWSRAVGNEDVTVTQGAGDAMRTQHFRREEIDQVTIDALGGDDRAYVDLRDTGSPVDVPVRVEGGQGNDKFQDGKGNQNDYFSGGQGNDTFVGGGGDDRAYGGPDDDLLWDSAGSNYLDGGEGADALRSGGEDTLVPGPGVDRVINLQGNDTVYAPAGEDRIVPSGPADATRFIDTK